MVASGNPELNKLSISQTEKAVIVGIGNIMKGDDAAGPELIRRLEAMNLSGDRFVLLDVGEVPENYLQKIVRAKPGVVLLVDIADMKAAPGTIRVMNSEDVVDNSLSTHNASLKLTMDYIKAETDTRIFLVGIQPENLGFGDPVSPPVDAAISTLCRFLGSGLEFGHPFNKSGGR